MSYKHIFIQVQGSSGTTHEQLIEQLEVVIKNIKSGKRVDWRSTKDTGYWYTYDSSSDERDLFEAPEENSVRYRLLRKGFE